MLIAEQLTLLCLDPARGEIDLRREGVDAERLAAAALLLDLAEQRRLVFNAGHVAVDASLPASHPVLIAAVHALGNVAHGVGLAAALELIEERLAPLARRLLEGLFRRDIVHRLRTPRWWPWARLRYPLRSAQARNEAIAALRTSANGARSIGLLTMVDCAGRLGDFLDVPAREQALARLNAPSMGDAGADRRLAVALRDLIFEG